MDLTQHFPRSPKEKALGLVHIPRMIDKSKAYQAQKLGEYIFPCPLDEIILKFLEIDGETFAKEACNREETNFFAWIENSCLSRNIEEKEALNLEILQKKPDTEENRRKFVELRNKVDPSRTDIDTWVDLIDLEENRL